ncbi:hypothetical protein cyc_00484 [Cyclospora cayetanensis]|uniref:Uncharacterized protein n=1 Tax=Cyclospora cayetanensis TaxID=88456 RepID=A0A1D3D5A8_9EIME|nr:hypothetical protein cyc_00484 [Cyclospora cayetanensis]
MLGTPQRRQRLVQWQEQLKQSKLEHYLQYHLQQHLQQQYLQQHLQQQLQQQLQQRLQQQLGDTQLRVQQCLYQDLLLSADMRSRSDFIV